MPHLPASLAHADARQEHSPKWLLALAELTEMPEQRWLVDSHMWALSPRSMRHARWRAPARPSLSHGTPECRLNGSTRARQSMRKSVRVTCFLLPARAYCWIGLHSARARSSIRLKFQIARLQLRAQRVTFQLAVRLAQDCASCLRLAAAEPPLWPRAKSCQPAGPPCAASAPRGLAPPPAQRPACRRRESASALLVI